MLYQIILFDLDDTLIDFTASETHSLHKVYAQFYQSICSYDNFLTMYKEINNELWSRVGSKEYALMPSDVCIMRFEQLNRKLNHLISAAEVEAFYEYHLGEHIDWLPNVKSTIEFLHGKGHILGIITNGLSDSQSKKRQRLELHRWFDCFIVSDEIGIAKPNKEIFDIALQNIAQKRGESHQDYNKNAILMVGDSLISDGHGAMNFGINYCYINNNSAISSNPPNIHYHINSVASLPFHLGYEEPGQS